MKCSKCGKDRKCHELGRGEILCKECILDRSEELAAKYPDELMALSLEKIAIIVRTRRDATDDILVNLKGKIRELKLDIEMRDAIISDIAMAAGLKKNDGNSLIMRVRELYERSLK